MSLDSKITKTPLKYDLAPPSCTGALLFPYKDMSMKFSFDIRKTAILNAPDGNEMCIKLPTFAANLAQEIVRLHDHEEEQTELKDCEIFLRCYGGNNYDGVSNHAYIDMLWGEIFRCLHLMGRDALAERLSFKRAKKSRDLLTIN